MSTWVIYAITMGVTAGIFYLIYLVARWASAALDEHIPQDSDLWDTPEYEVDSKEDNR